MSKQAIGFDYTGISQKHKQLITDHAKAITEHLRHTTASMVDIGRRLIQIRQLLGSAFRVWIDAEFQWCLGTARHYMILAQRFGNLDCLDNFQPSALILLSPKHVPQAAIDEAIACARSGQLITKSSAASLVDRTVLAQFSATQQASSNPGPATVQGPEIRLMTAALAAGRVERRGRPTKTIRTLIGSVQTMRNNIQQVYEVMSEPDRKSLSDDLIELANQLIHEPIIEADVETSDEVTESETVAFPGNQCGRRELATV